MGFHHSLTPLSRDQKIMELLTSNRTGKGVKPRCLECGLPMEKDMNSKLRGKIY
uniref:Uncharacterized protein n=1 Tax=Nelumbo nucifera TaxID=4432 RepID=A0A822ZTB6_NELNU|nr:TPA_asm: hypothetical protein HUJ06_016496 [Nelumbo nucifera]